MITLGADMRSLLAAIDRPLSAADGLMTSQQDILHFAAQRHGASVPEGTEDATGSSSLALMHGCRHENTCFLSLLIKYPGISLLFLASFSPLSHRDIHPLCDLSLPIISFLLTQLHNCLLRALFSLSMQATYYISGRLTWRKPMARQSHVPSTLVFFNDRTAVLIKDGHLMTLSFRLVLFDARVLGPWRAISG